MITDGKPTCLKENGRYYKNSMGLDRKVMNKTLNMAAQCKRLNIPITTFMIAQDPYLQQFVRRIYPDQWRKGILQLANRLRRIHI